MSNDVFSGNIQIQGSTNTTTVTINGNTARVGIGGGFVAGTLFPPGAKQPIDGNPGVSGALSVNHHTGEAQVVLNADSTLGGNIFVYNHVGKQHLYFGRGSLHIGGNNGNGALALFPGDSENVWGGSAPKNPTIILTSQDATSKDAQITLRENSGQHNMINLNGANAAIVAGGGGQDGQDGSLILREKNNHNTINLDGATATIVAGKFELPGKIVVRDNAGKDAIYVDGATGDIVLLNADCAEYFDVTGLAIATPGTVMVIDDEGSVRQSSEAYDKRVAGVVSGAGEYKPAIVLDHKGTLGNRVPLALLGKVYCSVDTQYAPIEVGDLLTTSPTAGHAMKAGDPARAFGAVIGKALRPLRKGAGMIPILVALQ